MGRSRNQTPLWERPTYLYKAYDEAGGLLYVGITENVTARLRAGHRKNSDWYSQARLARIYTYADRHQAIAVESWVIAHEKPAYNYEPGTRYLPGPGALPDPLETSERIIPPKRKYND